jgi:hypothetical protein
MSRLRELAGRLRHIEAGIAEVHGELDQTQTPCSHCGVKGRTNVSEYYAAVALEGSMTRIRRAADGLQTAEEEQ